MQLVIAFTVLNVDRIN